MPRPTKLTRARAKTITDTIAAGNAFETASRLAGIDPATAYRWMERGHAERQRIEDGTTPDERTQHDLPPEPTERPFREFCEAVERARAQAEAEAVAAIRLQIRGGWLRDRRKDPESGEYVDVMAGPDGKLALEWLSRVAPTRYGRRQTLEVSGPEGGPIGVDASAGARIAARLDAFMRQVREDPQVIEGQVVRRAIEAGRDGSVVFDADDAGEQPGGGGGGEPDGAGV